MSQKMNPFPGLRPFEMEEKYLFFGREDQTVELLKRLGQARFLAVVGTSGSGKSSLVRAGLLPELHGGTMTDAGSSWEISVMRPGGDPLTNLARALEDSGIYDTDEDNYYRHLRAMLGRSTMGLIEAVAQSKMKKEDNLLIVVDQFEEIFRFRSDNANHAEEAASFINLLLEAAEQTEKSIFVIITMRSDFLGDCSQFRGLAEAVNEGEYLIPRLNRNQRRLAIEGPVKVGGKQIEARLVQQLLNDIGDDPDQLPILQHALMRTWEYHEKGGGQGNLDLEHYEATGGMQEALSRHADEVYDELQTDEDRKYCEKIFKALTERVSEGRGIRHPMAMGELAEVVGVDDPRKLVPIVEAYRAAGRTFLMPPDSIELGPKVVVDISHESLMRVWGHLVGWVDEEAQSARIYRRLADTSQLFRENKAGLYRDPDLQISLAWRDQNNPTQAWADRYYPGYNDAMAFLEESHETAIADERAKEEARKRELEQARRLAEEERKSKSLWQKLVWTFGVAVIAITVGLIYIIESRETIRNNLSRVSLKEANRLANNNQQDEAIALLAKTIEDNSSYMPAGVRLVSLLEHTAMPRKVEKIHSATGYEVGSSDDSILLDAVNGYIVEFGVKDDLSRCRVVNLNGSEIHTHTTTNQLRNGRLAEDGSMLFYGERNRGQNEFVIHAVDLIAGNNSTITNVMNAGQFELSANGKILAAFSDDGSFSVLESPTGKKIYENTQNETGGAQGDFEYAFSRDGKLVVQSVINPGGAEINLFDITTEKKKLVKQIPMDQGRHWVSFSKESKFVMLNYWMMKNNEFSFGRDMLTLDGGVGLDINAGLTGFPRSNTTFIDDNYIVSCSSTGELSCFFRNGKTVMMKGHKDTVRDFDLSIDGMILASASSDRTVRLWAIETGDQQSVPIRFEDGVIDVSFSPDGNSLYAAVSGGNVYRIDGPFLKLESTFDTVPAGRSRYHYNSSSDRFAHLSSTVFSLKNFKSGESKVYPVGNATMTNPNGDTFYNMGVDWGLRVARFLDVNQSTNFLLKTLELESGDIVQEFALPSHTSWATMNDDGDIVTAITGEGNVELWDAVKHVLIGKPFHVGKSFNYAFPSGIEGIIFCGGTYSSQLFDSSTGKSASPVLRSRSLWFHHLARSETLILVSPRLSTVYFWQKGFSDFEAVMLDGQFGGLGVNKDETILAVSSDGGTVKFIDLNSRKPVGKALHHQEDVRGIVFHPLNDRYVFTLTRGAKLFGWDRREQNVFMGPVQLLRGRNLFIDDTGKNITSKSYSGQLFRVPVQIPDEGTDYSSWLPGLAKSMIGFGISDSNTYEMYSGEVSIGGLPPEVRDWVKWLRDDSSNRSAGPTVNVKVSQLIEDLSDSTNLYQLRQALRLRPNNPEVLSQFAYQLVANAGPSDDPEIQARFISAKARELGGNKAVVFYRSAQIEKVLNNQADALKYIDRAVELDSGSVEYLEFRKTLLDNN